MLEQSPYTEVEHISTASEEDGTQEALLHAGSGMLYAQQMLQETLAMTRGRTGRLSTRKRDGVNSSQSKGLDHSSGHKKLQLTKCTPFKLATDERCSPRRSQFPPAFSQFQHEQHQIKMQIQRQKQEAEERERRQFKTVNCHSPRSPSTPRKAPTEPQPFDLESPRRHEDYVNFRFPEKLAKEEEMRRQEERLAKRKEAQRAAEIKSLRKNLVFKARPAPDMSQYWVPDLSAVRPCTSFEPFRLTPSST